MLVVLHLNKSTSPDVLRRIGGSVGFQGAARSALLMTRDPGDPDGERGARRIQEGLHPGIVEVIESTKPEDLAGSVFQEAYAETAPNPENWPTLIGKCNQLDREFEGWPPADIESIVAPMLVIIGDSHIVRPEHAVEIFRLLGGGVEGDTGGLPPSQLAVLPGTTHLTLVERADWLVSMISAFLDGPLRESSDR